MPTRPGKKLKAESRLFSTRKVIKSLSRKNFTEIDLQLANLNTQLESLEQLVQNYTTPVDDKYPVLSEADKIALSKAYSQAVAQCEHVLSFRNNKQLKDNISYKAMVKMVERTQQFLTSDLRALTALNAKLGATLPEALENGRTAIVNVKNANVGFATGGCMSSRLPISISTDYGYKVEGMFTKTTTYNFAETSNAFFQKLIDMSSKDEGKAFWRSWMLEENDIATKSEKLNKIVSFYKNLATPHSDLTVSFNKLGNPYLMLSSILTENEKENINKYLHDLPTKQEAKKIYYDYSMNTSKLELESGANIDKRNTAMSIVANLLGRSDLLANSVSMTIEADGVKQTGTFMEFVKGASDVSHLKPDDLFFDCEIVTGIDGRPVLKDMADLQVIDYICGNVDRHAGNMLYIHDEDEYGVTYLKGIKAIDNDGSFAVRDLSAGFGKLSSVPGMKVISESMAKLVTSISPASLKLALKGSGLSDQSINAAVSRLFDVKAGIKNNALEIVKDDQWKDKKLEQFKKTQNEIDYHGYGVFTMVALQYEDGQRAYEKKLMKRKHDKGFTLADAEMKDGGKGYVLNEAQQIKARNSINRVVEELDAVKNVWFGSSKFKNMLTSAKALKTQLDTWAKQSEGMPQPVWDAKKFEQMTRDLRDKTELYLERKFMQSASKANRDNSIKRILAANTAMDFTHKFLDKVELSVWDEYKQNNAEYNMIEFAKTRQQQKNIGNAQKNANKNIVQNKTNDKPQVMM